MKVAQVSKAIRNWRLCYLKETLSPLTANNSVKLLVNGENKFPEVIKALKEAKNHIHLEYYIYEDDEIGRKIEQVLVEKAKEGIEVRFIYDDFGSRSIRRTLARRLNENGVKAYPFLRIYFIALANRLNYRNHRKIIVIDGQTAFVGGINVDDRYINNGAKNKTFWRDTHLRIDGPGVQYLQYLFLCDWNFCADLKLHPNEHFFPLKLIQSQGIKKSFRLPPVVPIPERLRFCFLYCRPSVLQPRKSLLPPLI